MKKILLLLLLCLGGFAARGQTVGLVLSGGGAKGLYHVGIIKALEENNIPIDYVSGASMGAIVGGMYAAGYSPDEMIAFFITDSVQNWLSAKNSDLDNNYYFKKFLPTPEMLSFRVNPGSSENAGFQLPTNIVSPYEMDLAFINMLGPASAAAGCDFDSLMIPFRCNASDIYNKKSVVFNRGDLPFAIRTSMTIPLVFKPLTRDSLLLFDGGIYNNFPWQDLDSTFRPDFYIGGICATNYDNPPADNIIQQITVMATKQTDYSLPDSLDVLIQRRFKDIGTLDYNRAGYIIARGYEDAMKQMPLIKERVKRRVTEEEVEQRRHSFRDKIQPLVFEGIDIEGLNPKQTEYVYRQLGLVSKETFDYAFFKRKYMQILAGGIFTGDFPQLSFNEQTGRYRLKLKLQTQASMRFSLGGNISSTALNQGYAAFSYRTVGNSVSTYALQGYFGTFYNSIQAGGRHDMYTRFPFYVSYTYGYENYDFGANHMNNYYRERDWRYNRHKEHYLAAAIGIPVLENAAFRGRLTAGRMEDRYFQGEFTNLDKQDHSRFLYASLNLEVQTRTFNYTLYPTLGNDQLFQLRLVNGAETFSPGSLAITHGAFSNKNRYWAAFNFRREHYLPVSKWLTLGYHIDAALSNHPDFDNPVITAVTEPAFQPIPLMQTMFMPEFRSPSYFGAGFIPVFHMIKSFYLKTYAYAFVPQEVVFEHGWKGRIWDRAKTMTHFVFGGSLVYQTMIGPASLTFNKYTTDRKNWQLVFNFGYTLFSNRKY